MASSSSIRGRARKGYLKDSTEAQLGEGTTETKLHEEKEQ